MIGLLDFGHLAESLSPIVIYVIYEAFVSGECVLVDSSSKFARQHA